MIDGSMQRAMIPRELWLPAELYQRALDLDFVNMLSYFYMEKITSDLGLFRCYMSTVKDVSELLFHIYAHFMKVLYVS